MNPTEYRRANLTPPATIDEARERLVDADTEIETIRAQVAMGIRFRNNGEPMSDDEYIDWRKRATGAMNWKLRERAVVQAWIEAYERDIATEEARDLALEKERLKTQRAQQQTEAQRIKKEAHAARQKMLQERETAARQWAETMITQHGTTRIPPEVLEAQRIEAQRLALERGKMAMERQRAAEANSARRRAHREWIAAIEAEEPINGLDADNLLRHAVRALRALHKRGALNEYERAVMNVLEQREYIRGTLEAA